MIKMGGALQKWWRRPTTNVEAPGSEEGQMWQERHRIEDQNIRLTLFRNWHMLSLYAMSEYHS